MPNDINRWNNALGYNMYDMFADDGASIDENTGYLNVELGGKQQMQAVLDMLGVSLFANSDLFLHGFKDGDFINNTKEETNQISSRYFEGGLRFGQTSLSGNILATASLQKENDIYSNKIDDYNSMGSAVVIINIPHHYKDIHMGKALRANELFGDSYEEKTARLEHQRSIALDGMGLDSIPKEFIVGVYFRDYTKPEARGSGRLILNPNYLGFENNLQTSPNGEVSNYDSLRSTILNAPYYDNSIIYDAEPSMDPALTNSEAERVEIAICGMAEMEASLSAPDEEFDDLSKLIDSATVDPDM